MEKTVKETTAKRIAVADQPSAAIKRKGAIIWLAISALVVLVATTFTLRRRLFSKGKDE
jgi:hypothetical protein